MTEGRDKRAHKRVRVRIRARTRGHGALSRQVEIRDIALGGMYIAAVVRPSERRPPHPELASDDGRVHVDFGVEVDGKTRAYSVAGRPVRLSERGFGLSFDGQYSDLVRTVLIALGESAAAGSVSVSTAGRAVLDDVRDAAVAWLSARMLIFMDQAEARLLSRAGSAHSNAGQTPFFDAIAELKRALGDLDAAMADALLARLRRLGAPLHVGSGDSGTAAPLSLVDKDEFEIYLSIADMASKAEHRNEDQLFRLCRYLTALAGRAIDNNNNPLGPQALCDPFHEVMSGKPIANDALGIIYHSFEDHVVAELRELYDDLLKRFDDAGVEAAPEPERAVSRRADTRPRGADRGGSGGDDASAAHDWVQLPDAGPPQAARGGASGAPQAPRAPAGTGGAAPAAPASGDLSPLEAAAYRAPPQNTGTTGTPAGGAPSGGSAGVAPGEVNPGEVNPDEVNRGEVNPFGPPAAGSPFAPVGGDPFAPGDDEVLPSLDFDFDAPSAAGRRSADGAVTGGAGPAGPGRVVPGSGTAAPAAGSGAPTDPLDGLFVPDVTPSFLEYLPGRADARLAARRAALGQRIVQPPAHYALPASPPGSAFGAAHTLLGLSRGLVQPPPAAEEGDAAPALDADALLATLADVQRHAAAEGGSFRAELREALGFVPGLGMSRHGELGDAVELIARLFEAMREDPEISDALRERLDALEPVLHQVAVLDPAFFEVASHPARQLLNQLARLTPELYESSDTDDADMWATVDLLIAPLVEQFDRDFNLIDAVLLELDAIVERQQQTYAGNVSTVVEACEAQARFIRARRERAGQAPGAASPEPDRGVSREWAVWLNRAARLEAGENLELRASGAPKRQRIAWVADEHASFVLVDGRGNKAGTYSRQELAMQLRRGTVTIVRELELPLVDRALNRVLQDMHGSVERNATHDASTGLLNRRAFAARLRAALDAVPADGDGVVLLYFLIDGFDGICDEYGEEAGSVLVRRVARRIAAGAGDGTELAVLVPGGVAALFSAGGIDEAQGVAHRICDTIARMAVRWGEVHLTLEVHAVAMLAPAGDDPETVLTALAAEARVADAAAEDVRVTSRSEATGAERPDLMEYVTLINNTLGKDQLQLRCHRVSPLAPGRRSRAHFEVLLGIRDEDGNAIAATEFIRAAEHYQQMPALDRWVLRNMMRWMAEHRRWLRHVGGFSINLSAASFADDHLVEYVLDLLNETGVPPGKLIFEITESVASDASSPARNFVRTLAEVGCQFALDDFGGGESSYGYLKQLQVAWIKIDGTFTRNVSTDESDLAVVKSVNEVAHFMGKRTIAEQVQSAESLSTLYEVGVDYVQGFHVERPVYIEALNEDMLKDTPAVLLAEQTGATVHGSSTGNAVEQTLNF